MQNISEITTVESVISPNGTGQSNGIDTLHDDDIWLTAVYISNTVILLCSFIAFIFNIFNICAIVSSELYKKFTYSLVVSLSVSDSIIALHFAVYFFADNYVTGVTLWKYYIALYNIYQIGSMTCVLVLITISVDLLIQNLYPFKYLQLSRFGKVILVLNWAVVVTLVEVIQVGTTLFHRLEMESFVDAYLRLKDNTLGYINLVLATVGVLTLSVLNIKTLRMIYLLIQRTPGKTKSSTKSSITIFTIITTYIIFYVPGWVFGIMQVLIFRYKLDILSTLTHSQIVFIQDLCAQFKVLNSIADPVVYAVRISAIRIIYKKTLLKLKFW